MSNLIPKPNFVSKTPKSDCRCNHWSVGQIWVCYGTFNVTNVNRKNESKARKNPSACVIFNKMIIYENIMTFVLQTSIKRPSNILHFKDSHYVFQIFWFKKWSITKRLITVRKSVVYSKHRILFPALHNVLFCLNNVKTNAPMIHFYGTCDVTVD